MSLYRVLAILRKDVVYGPRSFFFIQAVATPVLTTVLVIALFGSFLSGKPNLGFVYEGESELYELVADLDYLRVSEYESVEELQGAVEVGRLDMGISIPAGFDRALRRGDPVFVKTYIWGESRLKDRSIIFTGLSDGFIELAGKEVPVDITTITLGAEDNKPLGQRFLPLLVLMAIIMSGFLIPAATLVDEKQRGTLTAIVATPTSFAEVVAAKSLLGFFVGIVMGVVILALNRSFGSRPGALLLTLAMAAAFSSAFGGLSGVIMANANSLMTLMKSLMLVIYAPAVLIMFPKVPTWIAKLFPTYYVFTPVVEVVQNNAALADVWLELVVLVALIAALVATISVAGKRMKVEPT